jgi:arginase
MVSASQSEIIPTPSEQGKRGCIKPRPSKLGIVGVPLDFGAEVAGVGLGPAAMRVARLNKRIAELGYEVRDLGDLPITRPVHPAERDDKLKYLHEIKAASENLASVVLGIFQHGEFPIIIGGDHAVAIGTISGVATYHRTRSIGLIWFDAHGDMNTAETTPSGNIHGMPLAVLFGYGAKELTHVAGFAPKLDPRYCVHIGGRDIDPGERELIRRLGLRVITMREIDERGMRDCMDEAISIAKQAEAGYHVTLDVDVLDPTVAPGSGTVVRGGLSYREAHLAMEKICEAGGMISFEIVEINTTLDVNNKTAELGVELILSALGKTIL